MVERPVGGQIETYDVRKEAAEAFFLRPKRPVGAVIVVHTVGGFTKHVEETCERLAGLGFVASAPFLYWRQRDLFTPERIREAMKVVWDLEIQQRFDKRILARKLATKGASKEVASLLRILYDRAFRVTILRDLTALAETLDRDTGAVGAIGFSMGGKLAIQLGTRFNRLRASVAYSAEPPARATVSKVRSPILMFYGGRDDFMTSGVPAFVGDALRAGVDLTLKSYPSAGHEFFDPMKRDYDQIASGDAWRMTAEFLLRRVARKKAT